MNLLAPLLLAALAQAAPPPPPPPFSGVVVDPAGEPVAGARVWLAGTPWYTGVALKGEARTDAEGRFSMPRPSGLDADGGAVSFTLWAHAAGRRIGVRSFVGDLPGPDVAVRVAVGPPARTVIRLVPPDPARPIGGKVEVFEAHREPNRMPRAMVEALAAPIGADGVATLDGYLPEDIRGLDARTEAYGTQTRQWYEPTPGERTIRLRPIGGVAGRLIADAAGPANLKGWKVAALSYPDDEPGYTGAVGYYREETDDQGRFRFPVLPTGNIKITARPPDGVAAMAEDKQAGLLKAGATVEADVPTQRAVIVEGFLREAGTARPIPGVWINLYIQGRNGPWNNGVRTDAQGHYAQILLPGEVSMFSPTAADYYRQSKAEAPDKQTVPEGVERFRWPDIELTRGVEVRGVVRDGQGRPVARASVFRPQTGYGPLPSPAARTDERGEFRIGGFPPGQEVRLVAKKGGEATPGPVAARAGDAEPVVLALAPSDAVALRGRVLGSDGRPVPDALIQLRAKARGTGPESYGIALVRWEGDDFVRTGPDGTFETPRELAPNLRYRAEAVAAGMAPAQTDWIDPPATQLPDLALRRLRGLRAVAGRVVDRSGAPVAGVEVAQSGDGPVPTRSVTDDAGRFRVDGVLDDRALLFARKDRFRTQIRPIGPGPAGVEIVLARVDEQPAPAPAPAAPPPAMTRAEEKDLARRLVAAERARILAGKDNGSLRFHLLELDARLEPDRTIEQVENQVVQARSVLSNLALGISEDDPQGALDLVESDRDDAVAATAYLALHDALPRSEAGRRDLLDRAERRARALPDSPNGYGEGRMSMLARVADRRLDLGERDRAVALLGEVRAWFDALPKANNSFWDRDVIRTFARLDLPRAVAFLDRDQVTRKNNPGVYDNNAEAAAIGAADSDPAEAERLLGRIQQDYTRREATRKACLAMAGRDLDRARRLAADLKDPGYTDPTFSPLLAAVAAREAASADPRTARARLDEAFAALEKLAQAPGGRHASSNYPAAMAMLLPVAERIDPALVPEYLARTLAARPPRGGEVVPEAAGPAALLAMFLARYDAEAAAIAFGRVVDDLFSPSPRPYGPNQQEFVAVVLAASAFDPRAAMAVVDRIPDDPATPPPPPAFDANRKATVRIELARALGRPIPARRAEVLRTTHQNWPVERLDQHPGATP